MPGTASAVTRTRAYIAPATSSIGSTVRTKRPAPNDVKRVVAKKLIAISQKAITTSPQMTAWTLTGIVTANTTDIITFLATSSFTISAPPLLTFNTL